MRILQHDTSSLEAVDSVLRVKRFFESGIGFAPGDFVRREDDLADNKTFGIVVAMDRVSTTVLWSKPPRSFIQEMYDLVKMTGRYIPSTVA